MSKYAPAIYFADVFYLVPSVFDEEYLPTILDICKKEKIQAVTTLIDPEIEILSANREKFAEIGVEVLAPYVETAELCFDKFKLFKHLKSAGIPTPETFGSYEETKVAINSGNVTLPVFVKPRTGSGSVGARRVDTLAELEKAFAGLPKIDV